jgi:hypothetical protein
MPKLNRVDVASYLASLYKTSGNGESVSPIEFTDTICNICDCDFVEMLGGWRVSRGDVIVSFGRAKSQVQLYELKPNKQNTFSDVAAYVKWDLIHTKLTQLNDAKH